MIAPSKGMQDNLGFSILRRAFQISGADSSFWEWILNSLVVFRIQKPRILDSKSKTFPDSGFYNQKFPGFRKADSLTWGEYDLTRTKCGWKTNFVKNNKPKQNSDTTD